jgi:hypothetical protein
LVLRNDGNVKIKYGLEFKFIYYQQQRNHQAYRALPETPIFENMHLPGLHGKLLNLSNISHRGAFAPTWLEVSSFCPLFSAIITVCL